MAFPFGRDMPEDSLSRTHVKKASTRLNFDLSLIQTFLRRQTLKFFVFRIDCSDQLQCLMCYGSFHRWWRRFIHGLTCIGKISSGMGPTVCVYQAWGLLLDQMILLQTIRHQNTIVALVELQRMLMMSGLLVLIQDDGLVLAELPGTMHPHVTLGSG